MFHFLCRFAFYIKLSSFKQDIRNMRILTLYRFKVGAQCIYAMLDIVTLPGGEIILAT